MFVSWFGLSAVKIETKGAVIVTDPFAPEFAKKPLRAKADLVTISVPDDTHGYLGGMSGEPFVVDHPGEFEIKGVFCQGVQAASEQVTTFIIDVEEMRLVHLGALSTRPTNEMIERFDAVDVLFLPVGGGSVLSPEDAAKVVSDIEPRMVIPMYYAQDGVKSRAKLSPLSAFLKEMGSSSVKPVERLLVKKRDLPSEEMHIAPLERS